MKLKSRRNKCVMTAATTTTSAAGGASFLTAHKTPMPHDKFINRIQKSLYFGANTLNNDTAISLPLAEYASEIFSEPHKGYSLNRLTAVAAASIKVTPCSLIMSLIYLDRLNMLDPGYARRITPQELFIVSMLISTKFYAGYDEWIDVSDWAVDGDISEERLKHLEIEFLSVIDWNIYISCEQFFEKLRTIERTLAEREGLKRGWLTYTELSQILPPLTLAKLILNNITAIALSYAASVITIAGAFFLVSQIPKLTTTTNNSTTGNTTEVLIVSGEGGAVVTDGLQIDSITTVTKTNSTCNALNVELELLKLECEYREEALIKDKRSRHNEINKESRLTLPEGVMALNEQSDMKENIWSHGLNNENNWLALKTEFSDQSANSDDDKNYDNDDVNDEQNKITDGYSYQLNCMLNFRNCSTYYFWNLFSNVGQHSFNDLSIMWFKFI